MKRIVTLALVLLAASVSARQKIEIVAHRGFWKTEATAFSENSIASLKEACENKFEGCELDIHTTADGTIIVNHDSDINGREIAAHSYSDFKDDLLPNGEVRPTLDGYLKVASAYPATRLVIEFKNGDDNIVEKTAFLLRKHGMYSPDRAMFISFDLDACRKVAELCPEFTNQYLEGDLTPEQVKAYGINGIDYHFDCFRKHPEWVAQAHKLGMSVNVWTVNDEDAMEEMIKLGVDAITTNEPLLLRSVLNRK